MMDNTSTYDGIASFVVNMLEKCYDCIVSHFITLVPDTTWYKETAGEEQQ